MFAWTGVWRRLRWPGRLAATALGVAGALLGVPAAPASADPAMWVVKDADTTIYLLGTIHALKPDVPWRNAKLEAAFRQSAEYWMEADIQGDMAVAQTYALNFGEDSQHPLAEKLDAADYAKFLRAVAALNMTEGQVAHMRPWLATLLLTTSSIKGSGYDPEFGVDRALETDAKLAGKPVKTFETAEQQLSFLAGMPSPVELDMLVQTLRDLRFQDDAAGQAPADIDLMEVAWLAGDTKGLYNSGFKQMRVKTPEFFDVIITRRNAAWISRIENLMKTPGTYFIAVGAGHLIGDGGLPALLDKHGYQVARY